MLGIGMTCVCPWSASLRDMDNIDSDSYAAMFDGEYVRHGNIASKNSGVSDTDAMMGHGFETPVTLVLAYGCH